MYSREEASLIRRNFWTTFGQYMKPISPADGLKVNWINYKTGHKGMAFKMNVDKREAYIGIVLHQKDEITRELFYEQLEELRSFLHNQLGEEWMWEAQDLNEQGVTISHVYTKLEGVNVFKQEDWPRIIAFLKERIILLDEFWSMAKNHFEPLSRL